MHKIDIVWMCENYQLGEGLEIILSFGMSLGRCRV